LHQRRKKTRLHIPLKEERRDAGEEECAVVRTALIPVFMEKTPPLTQDLPLPELKLGLVEKNQQEREKEADVVRKNIKIIKNLKNIKK
jgi:hypothetical protein